MIFVSYKIKLIVSYFIICSTSWQQSNSLNFH